MICFDGLNLKIPLTLTISIFMSISSFLSVVLLIIMSQENVLSTDISPVCLFFIAVVFTEEEKEKMRNLPRKECILAY